MSASDIASALVTSLGAASRFGQPNVGLDYSVMEVVSASCIIVSWAGLAAQQDQFTGPPDEARTWTFLLDTFSKDTGNTKAALSRTLACVDDVLGALNDDPTLQGTANRILEIRGTRDVDRGYEVPGGGTWLRMLIEVDVEEWLS